MKLIIRVLFLSLNALFVAPLSENQSNSHESGNGSTVYNPFGTIHDIHHGDYIAGACWIVILVLVRRLFHLPFTCCYRQRANEDNKTNDLTTAENGDVHKSSAVRKGSRKPKIHKTTNLSAYVPESTVLVLVGGITGIVLYFCNVFQDSTTLNPSLVFYILIVPIVMDAGWSVDKSAFYNNIGTILLFAGVGTLFNALMLAPLFYYGSKNEWGIFSDVQFSRVDAGIYAIIICAVDPVAVLSVFESMHIDKTLYVIVFGESLLNDGVSVVFYHAFDDMKEFSDNPEFQFWISILVTLAYFVYCCVISFILAIIFSALISFVTRFLYSTQNLQLTAFVAVNYLCYILAEIVKGSGILSLFFCVLFQRQFVYANLSYDSSQTITSVLNQLSQMSEGVIFLLMGLTTFSEKYGFFGEIDFRFYAFVCLSCYVTRFIVVYSLGFIANQFRTNKMSYRGALFIQSHGGLRGAIGYSLALTLNEKLFTQKRHFLNATAFMVYFSVIVLGMTIKPLVLSCKIRREGREVKPIFLHAQDRLMDMSMDLINIIIGNKGFKSWWKQKFRYINNSVLKKLFMHPQAHQRIRTNSGLYTLHLHRSISEAQLAASDGGSTVLLNANRESFVSLMSFRGGCRHEFHNNDSMENFCLSGRLQDELRTKSSVPDLSILDAAPSRRDADDCLNHHSLHDLSAKHKRVHKTSSHHRRPESNVNPHLSHCYKHSHRVVNVKSKELNVDPDAILEKMRRNFDKGGKPCRLKSSCTLANECNNEITVCQFPKQKKTSLPNLNTYKYEFGDSTDECADSNYFTSDHTGTYCDNSLDGHCEIEELNYRSSSNDQDNKVVFHMGDITESDSGIRLSLINSKDQSSDHQGLSVLSNGSNGALRKTSSVEPPDMNFHDTTSTNHHSEKKVSFQHVPRFHIGDSDDEDDNIPTKETIKLKEELENAMVFQRPETPPESVVERSLPWKRDPELEGISSVDDTPQLAHEPIMSLHFLSFISDDNNPTADPNSRINETSVLKDSRINKICNLSCVIEEEPEDGNANFSYHGDNKETYSLPWREESSSHSNLFPDCQTPVNHTGAPTVDNLKGTSSASHSAVTAGGDSDICDSDRSSISKHHSGNNLTFPIVRKLSAPSRTWRFDDSEQPITSPMCSDILSISDRDTISHRTDRIKRMDSRSELTSIVSSAASLRRRHSFALQQIEPVNIFENDQSVDILYKTVEERMYQWLESVNPEQIVDEDSNNGSEINIVINLESETETEENVAYA